VRDAQDENCLTVVFDPANRAVASDSISPETYFVARQRLSLETRIILAGDARLKKPDNPLLRVAVQPLEFS